MASHLTYRSGFWLGCVTAVLLAGLTGSSRAANINWTGSAGDGLFATAGNWSGGAAPGNNSWQDNGVFGPADPSPQIVSVPASRSVHGLYFTTAGWTISGGSFSNVAIIQSAGSGTNTISTPLNQYVAGSPVWTVGSGNTLVISSYYQRNQNVTVSGGGTVRFLASIGGYGSGTWGLHITGSTVRVQASKPYTSGSVGKAYLGNGGKLQLLTTVSNANSLISTGKIVDETGQGLGVSDIGSGYVQIAPASTVPPIAGNWTLTFQDEFNGSSVDGTKWRLGQHWAGMNGAGQLSPAMVSVSGGTLRLKTATGSTSFGGTTRNYASSELSTFANFRQQNGYFEARIKYPAVTGLWPAFWLMPDRGSYGSQAGYRRSYIKFDLTGVNPGTINTADLKLKVKAVQTGGNPQLAVFRLASDSWAESTITWNNKPTHDPVWIASKWNTEIAAGTDLTVNVNSYITQEMAGDKKISFVVADTYMRDRLVTLHSSEAVAQSDRPRLVINGQTYYASEDAYVTWGSSANTNYGSSVDLLVKDSWGDTATTFNGGMEIDIMESLGIWGTNKTQHALHWDGYGSSHQSTGSGKLYYPGGAANDWHTYGLYWESGLCRLYVDGVQTWSWTNSRMMSVPAYLLLSHQLGGWDNNNAGSQVNNQVMEVDYVRVWSGTASNSASVVTKDNTDAGGITLTGAWTASTSTSGYIGSNYVHDGDTGKGSKSVRYTPTVPTTGEYGVFARWTAGSNRASNVPITITAASGSETVHVDQRSNGGTWVLLGKYTFNAGTGGNILISNTGTDGHVIADAIRLSKSD